ncbi:MAG: response regulator transcription factor [Acidobacteriaceae bacterium]|nr:response regulator transcription factor [Acidobacteriaceae bacterium]MBV9937576.1 response regulator transcription factor [Acidobacteriaceae bacterium]
MQLLIVDDDGTIRSMLRYIIESDKHCVVGEAENGRAGVSAAESLRPDLILLDVSMPVMGGFPAARLLNAQMPELPIIFVTQHDEQSYVDEAFRCGAKGYVIKQAAMTELPNAIRTVMTGQVFCSPLIRF